MCVCVCALMVGSVHPPHSEHYGVLTILADAVVVVVVVVVGE